jgi:hypothetical protein
LVQQDHRVPRVFRVLQALRVRIQQFQVHKDLRVTREFKELRELKAQRAPIQRFRGHRDQKAIREFKVILEFRVFKE